MQLNSDGHAIERQRKSRGRRAGGQPGSVVTPVSAAIDYRRRKTKTRGLMGQKTPQWCEDSSAVVCHHLTSVTLVSTRVTHHQLVGLKASDCDGPTKTSLSQSKLHPPQSTQMKRCAPASKPPTPCQQVYIVGGKPIISRWIKSGATYLQTHPYRQQISHPHHLGLNHCNLPVELLPRDPRRHHHRVASRECFAPHAERIVRDCDLGPVRVVCRRVRTWGWSRDGG